MRILFVLLISLFVCMPVFAASNYATENAEIIGRFGGGGGISPVTEIIKVRYAMVGGIHPGLSSGDVVMWSINSFDGITISACIVDGVNAVSYAGVLVTDINTADSTTSVRTSDNNWGWMAIRGYCLAKIDTSEAIGGLKLVVNGATLIGSFSTIGADDPAAASIDIGVLLQDPGADTLGPVILK